MEKHTVIHTRQLTDYTYVLRIERSGVAFRSGQFICVGLPGDDDRPYSIYSGEAHDYLEILVKEVEKGNISRKLKMLAPGSIVTVDKPHGFFTLPQPLPADAEFIFIATGTGIAPFRSFVSTYPHLSYTLIHGVRYGHEAYERESYPPASYVLCTSGDTSGHYHGRVTAYLQTIAIKPGAYYYLCGNSEMIDAVYEYLQKGGVARSQIKTEMYF